MNPHSIYRTPATTQMPVIRGFGQAACLLIMVLAVAQSVRAADTTADMLAQVQDARERGLPVLITLCHEGETALTPEEMAQARQLLGADCVFATFSYPEESQQHPQQTQAFLRWANRYDTRHLPELLLLDSQQRAYAQITRDQIEGGETAQAIREAIELRKKRDKALKKADATTGLERAAALDEALTLVTPYITIDYRAIAQEIIALNQEASQAELKVQGDHYKHLFAQEEIDEYIQSSVFPLVDSARYGMARDAIDKALDNWDTNTETKQVLYGFKAQLFYSDNERDKALKLIDQAIALNPESEEAKKLRKAKEQIDSMPDP